MCDAIYIANTQQALKKRMSGHFSDLQRLLKKRTKSDSFAAHFVQHFNSTTLRTEQRKCMTFRIVKRSCIHKLQLGFVNVFIAPIVFSCFSTLNVIHLRCSVRNVVLLKCCTKWAANESDFCPFLRRGCRLEKLPSIFFLNPLSVTYINSVTLTAFYFIDNTFRMAFTFVDKFSVDF